MRLGVRAQLVLLCVGLIAATALVADATVTRSLEGLLTQRIWADLQVRLELIEREASSRIVSLENPTAWTTLAVDFSLRSNVRVTIVRADGTVLGDSSPGPSDLNRSLVGEPEIAEALSHGFGRSTRKAGPPDQRMMFVAAPFRWEDVVMGVVRLGVPVAEVDDAIAQLRHTVLVGWLLSMALAGLGTIGVAQLASRRVRKLTRVARMLAAGDLAARTGVGGKDELSELGATLDQLAQGLAASLVALRTERDLVTGIFAGMQEGVLMVDAQRRVIAVNPAVLALDIGPCGIGMTTPQALRHGPLKDLLERARSASGPLSEELETDGPKPRRILVNTSPMPLDSDQVLAVFVDVTQLRQLESMRRDFVANVSHELKTPLTAIRLASETLQAGALADPAAAEEFVGIVARNADRLHQLVGDLLDLARVESGHLRLHPERLELKAAVEACVAQFQPRAQAKGVRLLTQAQSSGATVAADARAVEQVLNNLVDNAIKFCPAGSKITVRLIDEEAAVRLSVEDNGPGIAAEHLPRLFERFYRVDNSRSRDPGGSGLGLSIARHLVQAMGGTIGVESTPQVGSSFWITLPAAPGL